MSPWSSRFYGFLYNYTGKEIAIKEKLFEKAHEKEKPNEAFLQKFSEVLNEHWPSLASLLLVNVADIKRKKGNLSPADQALCMLREWTSGENATYGQLLSCLRTVALFRTL